jgi:hypothetical protein
MAGATPQQLKDFMKDLAEWAKDNEGKIKDKVPDFDRVKNTELPEKAPVWDFLKERALDTKFLNAVRATGVLDGSSAQGTTVLKPSEGSTIKLEDFLQRMSAAVLKAQTQLDKESLDYLKRTSKDAHVLPSIYRVPKLSAQMRFALDVETEQSLNLIFYKRDEKTTSRAEQAIDFDVVSVPAPPDAQRRIALEAPRLDLVLDPFQRGSVLETIRAADTAATDPDLQRIAKESPNRVLIVAANPSPEGAHYLVIITESAKPTQVGTTRVTIPAAGQAVVQTIYKFTTVRGNEVSLNGLMLSLADRQEEFFSDKTGK